jgi:hypothetical protein
MWFQIHKFKSYLNLYMGQSYSTEYFYPINKSAILLNDNINLIIINCADNLKPYNYQQISYRLAGKGYIVVVIKDENKFKKQIRDIVDIFNKNLIYIIDEIKKYTLKEYNKTININKIALIAHNSTSHDSITISKSNNLLYKITHLILLDPDSDSINNIDNYNLLSKMIITTNSIQNTLTQIDKIIQLKGFKSDIFYNKYVLSRQEIDNKSQDWNMIVEVINEFIV